jgi:soluble calcium-activated nucleotidase 1
MGKEWTSASGEFENFNPMFVKAISPAGEVQHLDWVKNYKALRSPLGIDWPGYMIHESGVWSPEHKSWYFLPRRCSKERYNETKDEFMGCNVLISADESFNKVKITEIGPLKSQNPLGYSSFKFVPGTGDEIIVAIKSEEVNGKTASYVTSFTVGGKMLLDDVKFSDDTKYEGFEFI